MNKIKKHDKDVIEHQLNAEQAVLKDLEKQYKAAIDSIDEKVAALLGRNDANLQHVVHQVEHQKALKRQIEGILNQLSSGEFETISDYLENCYIDGFVGSMYSLHNQGIPLIVPIDQNEMVKAITTNTRLKEDLYKSITSDIDKLKKTLSAEITRGLASQMSYSEIARNINRRTKVPLSRAKNIARTEGHRIEQAANYDGQLKAIDRGASVVKQWNAVLDGITRTTHRQLDGQIREIKEPFEIGTKKAMYPGEFGDPAEDCNCRCVSLTRAKWALDDDELQVLKNRAEYFGLDKTKDLKDFKKKYLKSSETIEASSKSGKIVMPDVKLSGYALNSVASPDKAAAFKSALGYTAEHADLLKQNIRDHLNEDKFVEKGDNGYGMRYEFIVELTGLNGKKANVLTAWIQDGEGKRLTSIYVTKRKVTE